LKQLVEAEARRRFLEKSGEESSSASNELIELRQQLDELYALTNIQADEFTRMVDKTDQQQPSEGPRSLKVLVCANCQVKSNEVVKLCYIFYL
jgi:hypothetical protein